jgi:hypothetical protein
VGSSTKIKALFPARILVGEQHAEAEHSIGVPGVGGRSSQRRASAASSWKSRRPRRNMVSMSAAMCGPRTAEQLPLVMRRSWVQSLFSDASHMGVWIGGTSSMLYVANARITASAASGPIGGLRMGRATPAAR